MLLAIFTFLMTFAVIVAAYWFFEAKPARASRARLKARLGNAPATIQGPAVVVTKNTAVVPADGGRIAAMRSHLSRVLRESGISNPRRLFMKTCLIGGIFCVMTRAIGAPFSVVLMVGVATPFAPLFYLRRRRQLRLRAIEEMFPQAIELLSRALRAGHALSSACAMVAEEIPEPLASEFRTICEQQNFGMAVPDVLKDFADRAPLMDVRFFVTAVLTQRETGGNLSQVLDNLASVMRDRFRVNRQLQVLTAQGRMTGWVLGLFPVVLGSALMFWAPSQVDMLLNDPMGNRMLVGAVMLQMMGLFLIRRIVRVEY
jgi:tight adherence protein B